MPSGLGWDAGDEGRMQQSIGCGRSMLSCDTCPRWLHLFWLHGLARPAPVFSVV